MQLGVREYIDKIKWGINYPNKVPNLRQLVKIYREDQMGITTQTKYQILGNSLFIVNLCFLILMASSSSFHSKTSFKVFVCFREENVGDNFVSHIYLQSMLEYPASMFNEWGKMKENLMVTVPKMIEESNFAIIVFSEDNIYSELCLEEVAKIMECKKQSDLEFFPLFYKVKLDTVSGLKGNTELVLNIFKRGFVRM